MGFTQKFTAMSEEGLVPTATPGYPDADEGSESGDLGRVWSCRQRLLYVLWWWHGTWFSRPFYVLLAVSSAVFLSYDVFFLVSRENSILRSASRLSFMVVVWAAVVLMHKVRAYATDIAGVQTPRQRATEPRHWSRYEMRLLAGLCVVLVLSVSTLAFDIAALGGGGWWDVQFILVDALSCVTLYPSLTLPAIVLSQELGSLHEDIARLCVRMSAEAAQSSDGFVDDSLTVPLCSEVVDTYLPIVRRCRELVRDSSTTVSVLLGAAAIFNLSATSAAVIDGPSHSGTFQTYTIVYIIFYTILFALCALVTVLPMLTLEQANVRLRQCATAEYARLQPSSACQIWPMLVENPCRYTLFHSPVSPAAAGAQFLLSLVTLLVSVNQLQGT